MLLKAANNKPLPISAEGYLVREANLTDQPDLRAMTRHFLELTPYGRLIAYNEDAVTNLIVTVLAHGVIYVAEPELPAHLEAAGVNMRPVGMIAIAAFPHPMSGEPYADEVAWWVEPEHRGDLGPALLGVAEAWATTNGISLLKMVAPYGTAVGRFYERHGYVALETAYVKRLRPAA